MHGCEGKKTALLKPDFFIGLSNVLFCGWAVVDPNAPVRRKEREEKKLKPFAVMLAHGVVILLFLFSRFKFS